MEEAGQSSVINYESEDILAGNNTIANDRDAAIGTYVRGEILGLIKEFSLVGAEDAGNTGDGTIGTISAGAKVKDGVYTLTATGATTFTVVSPDGESLPDATVGTAYTNAQVNFTITAGGTPFVAGDEITITVTIDSETYSTLDLSASDGSEVPSGIAMRDITLSSAGPMPIAWGDFQRAGVTAVMAALSTPVTVDDDLVNKCDQNEIHLKYN